MEELLQVKKAFLSPTAALNEFLLLSLTRFRILIEGQIKHIYIKLLNQINKNNPSTHEVEHNHEKLSQGLLINY